eukprot:350975-Chlamydomonas_euryale.AAC.6
MRHGQRAVNFQSEPRSLVEVWFEQAIASSRPRGKMREKAALVVPVVPIVPVVPGWLCLLCLAGCAYCAWLVPPVPPGCLCLFRLAGCVESHRHATRTGPCMCAGEGGGACTFQHLLHAHRKCDGMSRCRICDGHAMGHASS